MDVGYTSVILALKKLRIQVWGQPVVHRKMAFQKKKNKTKQKFLLKLYYSAKSLFFQSSWKSAALHLTSRQSLPQSAFVSLYWRSLGHTRDDQHADLECTSGKERFPSTEKENARLMCCIVPPCQFGFYFFWWFWEFNSFVCYSFVALSYRATPPVLRCDFSLACCHSLTCFLRDLWAGAGSSSSLYWSQAVSVFLKSWAVEDKSLVQRSLTVPRCCRRPELTVRGQGSHSVFRPSLYSLYLATLSFPWENVNPCWQCREETGKAQVQGLPRLQSSKPAWTTTKARSCFQRGWRWVRRACLASETQVQSPVLKVKVSHHLF